MTPSRCHVFARDGLLWRCHQFASVKHVKSFWVQAVTLDFSLHDAVTPFVLTPSLSFDLVNFRVFLRFRRFPHFFAPKTSKSAPFVISSPKTPKMRKERLWVKSNQIMHELGLKLTPKNVTFFVSSNTLMIGVVSADASLWGLVNHGSLSRWALKLILSLESWVMWSEWV